MEKEALLIVQERACSPWGLASPTQRGKEPWQGIAGEVPEWFRWNQNLFRNGDCGAYAYD